MKSTFPLHPTRQDASLLRSTLLRLTARQKVLCLVVIGVVAVIWYVLLKRLIAFGRDIDYSGLKVLGVRGIEFLQLYNPFFWWGVVVLCTLIIIYMLNAFVQATRRHVRSRLVSAEIIDDLVTRLSDPANEVLDWVWHDRRHPITVGDLQRASDELHTRRADKIALAREHAAALDRERVRPQA